MIEEQIDTVMNEGKQHEVQTNKADEYILFTPTKKNNDQEENEPFEERNLVKIVSFTNT